MKPSELAGKLVVLNDGRVLKIEDVYIQSEYDFRVKFDKPIKLKREIAQQWRWLNKDFTFQFDNKLKIVKVLHD